MRRLIAATNLTLDGYCDHTAVTPDAEVHNHYTDLLHHAGAMLYGRITYGLMGYWRQVLQHPTGQPAMDDFAVAMDRVPKIVFSHTLKSLDWPSARLATRSLAEEVAALKQQDGKDIFAGSPGLIASLANLHLVDEFQFCIHPVIAGSGENRFFEKIRERIHLRPVRTKSFGGGAILLCYSPAAASPLL